MLGSAKTGHFEQIDQSAIEKTHDGYQGETGAHIEFCLNISHTFLIL